MLGSSLILGGVAFFAWWFFLRKKAKASRQWPTTRGRVIASQIQSTSAGDNGTVERVLVSYEYAVAGATLRGNRIGIGGSGSGSVKAQFARYQPGAEVDVFYDPTKPASAVLEHKLALKFLLLPIMGTFFLISGVWVLVKA